MTAHLQSTYVVACVGLAGQAMNCTRMTAVIIKQEQWPQSSTVPTYCRFCGSSVVWYCCCWYRSAIKRHTRAWCFVMAVAYRIAARSTLLPCTVTMLTVGRYWRYNRIVDSCSIVST